MSNPTIQLIQRVREDVVDRFYRGELNYERDRAVLLKHAQLTYEMGEVAVSSRIYNTLGMIELEIGHLTEAEGLLIQSFQLAEEANSTYMMSIAQNNLGELYRYQGEIPQAIKVYKLSREIAREGNEAQAQATATLNLGLCAASLKDYKTAAVYFSQTYELIKDAPWDMIRLLIAQRLALAEVYVSRKEFDAAWSLAEEAENLTLGRNFKKVLPEVYLTKAHILDKNPARRFEAKAFYEQARQGFREYGSPRTLALALLAEARYQIQYESFEDASRLANEALQMFQELEMPDYIGIAQKVLANVANT